MNDHEHIPELLKDLLDEYLDGRLAEEQLDQLETALRNSPEARAYFVRYAQLHTDLHLEMRAAQASERALRLLPTVPPPRRRAPGLLWLLVAASVLLLVGITGWLLTRTHESVHSTEEAVAWLVNAQNCQWAEDIGPEGIMQAQRVLRLDRGLAEIRFHCGATVVLEGPATLELLSGKRARLKQGRLTARVPEAARGFEILSPQGKIIDLGTEFGMAVADNDATDVYVFQGKVEALPATPGSARAVSVIENQAARISAGQVTVNPTVPAPRPTEFVRAIVAPPVIVPRILRLTFEHANPGSLLDANGLGTGLTHRLPGTGNRLGQHDSNLRLNASRGQLELTTTDSDLNKQFKLDQGEYLGIRLSSLGFTGKEDFEVTATIPNIPALAFIGQFGLYAGARSDRNIRGGLISTRRQEPGQYTQFLVNNHHGQDMNLHKVGLLTTGADIRVTLKRTAGQYSLTVENLSEAGASSLVIRHPWYLDNESDLFVGLFGANTHSQIRKTLVIKEFAVTVWTLAPSRKNPE